MPAVAYSYRKPAKGPPGLTLLADGPNAINSIQVFISYALRRSLGFNPGITRTETSVLGSAIIII